MPIVDGFLPMQTSTERCSNTSDDIRVEKLWQKMAQMISKKYRTECVRALKTVPCPYLNWRQRPLDVRQRISAVIDKLRNDKPRSRWGDAGAEEYNLLSIKDKQLIEQIIRQAPISQKDFYFLDVGAGEFQWSKSVAQYLNQLTGIPKDIRFHIIGVRGENYEGEKVVESGVCKIYNLGGFKIEELETEFHKLGLSLNNKIDLAVERLCFCHLVEPVGTFAQLYHLLRPETGMALFQNFLAEVEDPASGELEVLSISNLLEDLQAPFLTHNDESFLLKRTNRTPCRFRMHYKGMDRFAKRALYTREHPKIYKRISATVHNTTSLQGDRALLEWLSKNFLKKDTPLFKSSLIDSRTLKG